MMSVNAKVIVVAAIHPRDDRAPGAVRYRNCVILAEGGGDYREALVRLRAGAPDDYEEHEQGACNDDPERKSGRQERARPQHDCLRKWGSEGIPAQMAGV